jgi:hypothetical protein
VTVEDLTGSEADDEEGSSNKIVSSLTGSSSTGSTSSGLDLYDDGSQTFLSVAIIDVDEDPAENVKPLPVRGPSMAMLPGPSVVRTLVPVEMDLLNDLRFVPPCLRGGEARLDIDPQEEGEVKEEEEEGKVAGTPEFWAGDYLD